ncbi:MAG: ribosome-binding factor A, partial [Patescibacteria group bacterium]
MDRMPKVNELIYHELGRLISEEIETPGSLATITKVDVTPDLREARVSISVLPELERGRVVKLLQKNAFRLHRELNKRVKLRIVPKL